MRVTVSPPRASIGGRSEQQDAAAHRIRGQRFAAIAVCDGVGSTPRARIAAETAALAAVDYLAVLPRRRGSAARFLSALPAAVVRALAGQVSTQSVQPESATTLVAAAVDRDVCWTVTVGDSIAVLIRGESVVAATPRASVTAAQAAGLLPPDSRHSSALLRWLSAEAPWTTTEPVVTCWPLAPGDIVLVATDGVTESLELWELGRIAARALRAGEDLSRAVLDAVEQFETAQSDNATVAAIIVDAAASRTPRSLHPRRTP